MNFNPLKIKSKWFKKVLGIFFIILGVLGLFLPVLQGILFILIGLTLLENQRLKLYIEKFVKKKKKGKPSTQKTL